jgi:peroxiredoxin
MLALALLVGCTPVLTSPGGDTGLVAWVAPENGWPISSPPGGLQGEGFGEGQVVPDIRLLDQFGAEVSIWQFYGDVIVLDVSTMWCAPCQIIAAEVQETWEDYESQGFQYLTMLPENLSSDAPSTEELQSWAEDFGIEQPILSDDAGHSYEITGSPAAFPQIVIIDRDMTVAIPHVAPVDDFTIRAGIESVL